MQNQGRRLVSNDLSAGHSNADLEELKSLTYVNQPRHFSPRISIPHLCLLQSLLPRTCSREDAASLRSWYHDPFSLLVSAAFLHNLQALLFPRPVDHAHSGVAPFSLRAVPVVLTRYKCSRSYASDSVDRTAFHDCIGSWLAGTHYRWSGL